MIRKATSKDLPRILDLTKREMERHKYPLKFDRESVEIQFRNLIINRGATMLVAEEGGSVVGVVGGPIMNWPYDLHLFAAQEYVGAGKHVKELRQEFCKWAQANGALVMIKLCVEPGDGSRVIDLKGGA